MTDIVNECEAEVIGEGLYLRYPDCDVWILPTCHDYVDGSLDEIEAQSEGVLTFQSGLFRRSRKA